MRIAWLSIAAIGSLAALSAQALAQPPIDQTVRQDQIVAVDHKQPAQQVSDALGSRLDHMMLDSKPVRQR